MTRKFIPPSEKEFTESGAWGILSSVDIHDCDHEIIRNPEKIKEFAKSLCKKIKVRTYGDTQVVLFGDDPRIYGYSMVQLIESSLVSGHFAEDSNSVYLDIFSCKYYDPNDVVNFSMEFFKGKSFNAHSILRGGTNNLNKDVIDNFEKRKIILQNK